MIEAIKCFTKFLNSPRIIMAGLTKVALTCAILASMRLHVDDLTSKAVQYFMKNNEISPTNRENFLLYFSSIFYLIVPLAAGALSDLIGRKYSLASSSIFFFLGSLVLSLAPNYVVSVTGAFLAGIGTCFALSVSHVYITELSPDSSRGFLTTFPEVFWSIGYFLDTFVFANISSKGIAFWRLEMALGTIFSFLLAIVLLLTLPESPGWLVKQGKLSEERSVLIRTSYNEEEAKLRVGDIKLAVESKHDGCGWASSWKKLLLHPSPSILRALIAVVGLNFFRNSTGIGAVNLYSIRLLAMAGVKNKADVLRVTSVVEFIRICITLTAGYIMDKIGRRPLILASVAGMILTLAGLGLGLTIHFHSENKLIWAVNLSVTMAFFSTGLGPITWVYSSEAFPMRLRAQGASVGGAVNLVTRGLTSLAFLLSFEVSTVGGAFLLFAGIQSVAWLFFYKLQPETLKKSQEEKDIRCDDVVGTSDDIELSTPEGGVAGLEPFDGHEISSFGRNFLKRSASFPEFRPSSTLKNYFRSNITQL